MKIFKHKKQIDDTFDIVHLSGPKDNYNITESMGTLIYTGKDNKNKYELANIDKFCWAKGETLSSIWSIEYSKFATTSNKLDIFGDNSCKVTYNFDPIFDIEISQVNMLDSDTKLLLSGSLSDQTGKTITNVGGVTLSNTQIKNNSKSLYFNNSSYLAVPSSEAFNFGTGDYTVEAWVYLPSRKTTYVATIFDTNGSNASGLTLEIDATGKVLFWHNGAVRLITSTTVPLTTWTHIAFVRFSGITSIYINGIQNTSTSYVYSPAYANPRIGGNPSTTLENFFGYMDDLRVTKGVARYTSDFIPKGILNNVIKSIDNGIITNTQDSYTSLLLSGSLIEKTGKTLTKTGKLNTSSLETKNNNKSIYFDGSSYFTVPTSDDLTFGTDDFTIEMWFNITQLIDIHQSLYGTCTNGTTTNALTIGCGVDGKTLTLGIGYGSGASTLLDSNTKHDMNVWNHMAVTRTGGILRLFLNGKNVGQVANTTSFVTNNPIVGVMFGTRYFKGYIDDLRVSKGIARYTTNFTPKGLYHGVANNMITTAGKFGDALSFNGINSFINTRYKTPTTQGKLTISYWVYLPTVNTSPGIIYGTSEYTNIYCAINTDRIEVASLQANLYYFPKTKLVEGWNHIVVHHTTTPILYINNQLVVHGSTNNSIGVNLSKDLWIGRIINYYGSATIDQFRIFDRALTQDEVTKLFNEK